MLLDPQRPERRPEDRLVLGALRVVGAGLVPAAPAVWVIRAAPLVARYWTLWVKAGPLLSTVPPVVRSWPSRTRATESLKGVTSRSAKPRAAS